MSTLQSLKNTPKGEKALDKLIRTDQAEQDLSKLLSRQPVQSADAPWKQLLREHYRDQLIDLLNASQPAVRIQSASILLFDEEESGKRLLWHCFEDSNKDMRCFLIRNFSSEDRHKHYNMVFNRYLKDPIAEVRSAAVQRIRKDFSDLYSVDPEKLDIEEKIHCLELLDPRSSHDHNLALRFLDDDIPGIILSASLFLEKAGTLDHLIRKSRSKDEQDRNRRRNILMRAAKHQVTSFLEKKENFTGTAALSIALDIFSMGITSSLFPEIIRQVLEKKEKNPDSIALKKKAVSILCTRTDPDSILLQKHFLEIQDFDFIPELMQNLPGEGALLFYPVLKSYLLNEKFNQWESLIAAFEKIPLSLCLSDLYSIVRNDRKPPAIRKRGLIILSRFGDTGSCLFLLENISLLNRNEMHDMKEVIENWNRVHFIRSVRKLFHQPDSSTHRGLMDFLSLSGNRDFLQEIELRLDDSDPDSRVCALRALLQLDAVQSIDHMKGLLRDPEELVRREASRIFIRWNRNDCFSEISRILADPYESHSVKIPIIITMGESDNVKVIPMLVTLLPSFEELNEILIETLLQKTSVREIRILINLFAEAEPESKEHLQNLFTRMGEPCESALMELLDESDEWRSSICHILDRSGYVDSQISLLKHPLKEKRLQAARNLSFISTMKASRGLLIASRDINREIRILSLKALVHLQDDSEILDRLKEDPDKKVQRYAHWASERIKAGKI